MDNKKENVKKKVQFMEGVKMIIEEGMLCNIDGNAFFAHNNTWIREFGASCHNTINDTSLFDIININVSIQGSSINMPASKKGKLHVNV